MVNFENPEIAEQDLPDWAALELNRVARPYLAYGNTLSLVFGALMALGGGLGGWLIFNHWVGVALASIALLVLTPLMCLHSVMEYRLFGWAVREHDLVNRHGVLWRKLVVIPFSRIQHVSTGSGPVERWFGLMHLKVFTAGGASADVTVLGLYPDTAERIRHYVLHRIGALDDEQDPPERPVLASGDAPNDLDDGSGSHR